MLAPKSPSAPYRQAEKTATQKEQGGGLWYLGNARIHEPQHASVDAGPGVEGRRAASRCQATTCYEGGLNERGREGIRPAVDDWRIYGSRRTASRVRSLEMCIVRIPNAEGEAGARSTCLTGRYIFTSFQGRGYVVVNAGRGPQHVRAIRKNEVPHVRRHRDRGGGRAVAGRDAKVARVKIISIGRCSRLREQKALPLSKVYGERPNTAEASRPNRDCDARDLDDNRVSCDRGGDHRHPHQHQHNRQNPHEFVTHCVSPFWVSVPLGLQEEQSGCQSVTD